MSGAEYEVGPLAAVTFTFTGAFTAYVETVTETEVAPAGIVAEDGTDAAGLSVLKLTVKPPDGAGAAMVTVAVTEPPPCTALEDSERLLKEGGLTESDALEEAPLYEAVIVAVIVDATEEELTEKSPVVAPAGTSAC